MNPSFWRGKRVFLTGHTGFKGAWLSLWLVQLGARVCGFSLPPETDPNLFSLIDIKKDLQNLEGDIRDLPALKNAMATFKPDIIIHLAAQALVRYSYDAPIDTYATNVMGSLHVLEAARHVGGVKSIVMVTTDKCYENKEWVWAYRENEPLGGFDPYSSSKACNEIMVHSYRQSYFPLDKHHEHGTAVCTARAGNVIGGGDWASDRLIPDIIMGFVKGESVKIRHPHAIRPWQHVLESLSGYLLLAEKCWDNPTFANAWNFGPYAQDAKPVSWIVSMMQKQWGESASWTRDEAVNPHEAQYLKLDCSKAHAILGWQPRWSLVQALQAVVEWYKAWRDGMSMRELTLAQIKHYLTEQELTNIQEDVYDYS